MAEADPYGFPGEEDSPAVTFNGVLRASGKRFRRQFNPNDWESSILTIRHNVLCLGMSYPCVEKVIANYKKNVPIFHSAPSVERSVELVRRNLLNEIDGRDLARVVALEANNDILAYTVSIEQGAYYDQRHLNADFNSRTLVNQMHARWGKSVRFRQVILDYFWSPSGTWAMKHWQKSFFNENIPRLVTHNLLNFGDLENDSVFVSAAETNAAEDYISSTAAVVYLPFCSHCLSQVVACYDTLSQFFTISFLRKDQLDEHTLWKATNTISPESMRGWLAKTINQEEIYCKLDARHIKHGAGDASVTEEDILDVFNRIDRSDEVRMIKLTALRKFHPSYTKSDLQRGRTTLGLNKGGYVGLVRKRFAISRRSSSTASLSTTSNDNIGKQLAQMKPPGISRKRSLSHQQLDKLVTKPQGKCLRRSLSHHNFGKLGASKREMPRKMSLSHHQLDELVGRQREKRAKSRAKAETEMCPILDLGKNCPHGAHCMYAHGKHELKSRCSALDSSASHTGSKAPHRSLLSESPKEDPNALVGAALEWDRFLTTVEADYVRRINRVVGFETQETPINCGVTVIDAMEKMKGPVESESAQPKHAEQSHESANALPVAVQLTHQIEKKPPSTPLAMAKLAKSRCSKLATQNVQESDKADHADATKEEGSAQDDQGTPNVNDVLIGAHHHSHSGNIQFFSALSLCDHDFSKVADCFVDALKSLKPPGRFLGVDESDGTWACIDYNEALDFIPHLVDQYTLNIPKDMRPSYEGSSAFLSIVQGFYDAKLKGGEKNQDNLSKLSDALMADCGSIATRAQSIPGEVNCIDESKNSDAKQPAMSNENISTQDKGTIEANKKVVSPLSGGGGPSTDNNSDLSKDPISNSGMTKHMPLLDGKRRVRKGKSSALTLALAEHEMTEKASTSNANEKVNALQECESKLVTVCAPFCDDASDAPQKAMNPAPELIAVTDSSTNTSLNSGSVICNEATPNGGSAEDTSFKHLAEWLHQSTSSTQENTASMETALRQITEQSALSMLDLFSHAFEEEEAALRALCKEE